MAGNVLTFTDSNFETEVLKSSAPVLVDFWAPWCGPCKMIAPTIEAMADDYTGKVRVGKLNTDDNPGIATQFGIMSIPTVLVFKGGEVVGKFVGVVNRQKLASAVDPLVA